MKEILLYILLVLAFLSAAKSHGRQYRLERELQGHWTVSFTVKNDPWVEKFWYRQRVMYWSLASCTAILMIVGRFLTKESGWNLFAEVNDAKWAWIRFTGLLVLGSMIVAFVVTGLVSATRLAIKLGGNTPVPNAKWLEEAIWGSLGCWLLTAVIVWLLIIVDRR